MIAAHRTRQKTSEAPDPTLHDCPRCGDISASYVEPARWSGRKREKKKTRPGRGPRHSNSVSPPPKATRSFCFLFLADLTAVGR